MVNFDSPNRETCTVRETRTNTPLQALNLMNDETFLEASRKLAERAMTQGGPTPQERIRYLYRLVLVRDPKPGEEKVVAATLDKFEERYSADPKAANEYLSYGDSPQDSNLKTSELAAYATVASLILNLNETVTKD
jgi:rhamnose utilization protein RhaD (predicted bifunctional aldolase and dehydrogenase)